MLYTIQDEDHEDLAFAKSLEEAKEIAKKQFCSSELEFDGNIEFGADEIYIYIGEEVVGFIQIEKEE